MPYIFEMDIALLRMQYLLPAGYFCYEITTCLTNINPYNRSNLSIDYCATLCTINSEKEFQCEKILKGESLEDLVNQCRIWSILFRDEQQPVNKMTIL